LFCGFVYGIERYADELRGSTPDATQTLRPRPVRLVNPAGWPTAVVMAVSFLAALCGLTTARRPADRRHRRGDVPQAGRSVMSIRNRVLREFTEYRFTSALTIAVPTLYLATRGTLIPDTPTNPLRPPDSAAMSSPLDSVQFQPPDIELMQRVLDGLRRLPGQRLDN
jgi:hypothetical protein